MRTNTSTSKFIAVLVAAFLLGGVAGVGAEGKDSGKCPYAGPGVSLCARIATALHHCVKENPCKAKPVAKKKGGKGGLGFLSRLFI